MCKIQLALCIALANIYWLANHYPLNHSMMCADIVCQALIKDVHAQQSR